jgi:hypothetical protein
VDVEPRSRHIAQQLSDVCSRLMTQHISLRLSSAYHSIIFPRLQATSIFIFYSEPIMLKYIRPSVTAVRIDMTHTSDHSMFGILQILFKSDGSAIKKVSIYAGGSECRWRWLPSANLDVYIWPPQAVRGRLLEYAAVFAPKRIQLRDGFGRVTTDYSDLKAFMPRSDINIIEELEEEDEKEGGSDGGGSEGDTEDEEEYQESEEST